MKLRDIVCDEPTLEQMRQRLAGIYDSRPCHMCDESACTEDDRRVCPINRAPDCPRVMRHMSGLERDRIMHERIRRETEDAVRCRIPERLYDLLGIAGAHETLYDTDAVVEVRRHYRGVLVLMGPTNTGKTVAAAHWAWRQRAAFWRAEELATNVNWFDRREAEAISGAHALVIDDLGAEYGDTKGNWRSKLDALINRRYDAKAATIITTNLENDALRLLVGERVWRRIREDGRVCNILPSGHVTVPPSPIEEDDPPFPEDPDDGVPF